MKLSKLLFAAAIAVALPAVATANLINEFQPNPVSVDPPDVMVELLGTPGGTFSGWLSSIESDPGNSGVIDRSAAVSGSYDSNGIAVVTIPDLENPSFTFVFSELDGGGVGTDYDTNDDGTIDVDLSPFGTIYDAIGIPDTTGEPLYGVQLGGADFAFTGDEPKLAFRDGVTQAWYAVNDQGNTPESIFDLAGNQIPPSATWLVDGVVVDPEVPTFGGVNPTIPEPSSMLMALMAASAVGAVGMRRRLG